MTAVGRGLSPIVWGDELKVLQRSDLLTASC